MCSVLLRSWIYCPCCTCCVKTHHHNHHHYQLMCYTTPSAHNHYVWGENKTTVGIFWASQRSQFGQPWNSQTHHSFSQFLFLLLLLLLNFITNLNFPTNETWRLGLISLLVPKNSTPLFQCDTATHPHVNTNIPFLNHRSTRFLQNKLNMNSGQTRHFGK